MPSERLERLLRPIQTGRRFRVECLLRFDVLGQLVVFYRLAGNNCADRLAHWHSAETASAQPVTGQGGSAPASCVGTPAPGGPCPARRHQQRLLISASHDEAETAGSHFIPSRMSSSARSIRPCRQCSPASVVQSLQSAPYSRKSVGSTSAVSTSPIWSKAISVSTPLHVQLLLHGLRSAELM